MILRYLILFGGVVLMITGCNSLVSQNFGTHRLRTVNVSDANAQVIGEADFVEIAGAVIGSAALTNAKADYREKTIVYRPILSADQQEALRRGNPAATSLVGWFKTDNPSCFMDANCLPYTGRRAIGLIGVPPDVVDLAEQWGESRIELKEPVVYLQLGEKPMAWHWNLLIFIGGMCLAFVPEAMRHSRKASHKTRA